MESTRSSSPDLGPHWSLREGYLRKRGHLVPSLRRRFFSLDGATLSYAVAAGKRPSGSINLRLATLSVAAAAPGVFAFSITERGSRSVSEEWGLPGSDHSSGRLTGVASSTAAAAAPAPASSAAPAPASRGVVYQLLADSAAERDQWVESISCNMRMASRPAGLDGATEASTASAPIATAAAHGPSTSALPVFQPTPAVPMLAGAAAAAAAARRSSSRSTWSLDDDADLATAPSEAPREKHKRLPEQLIIWSGTWNMAEEAPPRNLGAWIPTGCDVYALSAQECMHTDALLMAVHRHLGTSFLELHHRIGSASKVLGFHGHIVVAVFVRDWMVTSGVCRLSRAVRGKVALGRNLYLARAENKGAVAISLPIRLPDAEGALTVSSALIFASCHLTSDSKGSTRLVKRNRDARNMLAALGLDLGPDTVAQARQQAGLQLLQQQQRETAAAAAVSAAVTVLDKAGAVLGGGRALRIATMSGGTGGGGVAGAPMALAAPVTASAVALASVAAVVDAGDLVGATCEEDDEGEAEEEADADAEAADADVEADAEADADEDGEDGDASGGADGGDGDGGAGDGGEGGEEDDGEEDVEEEEGLETPFPGAAAPLDAVAPSASPVSPAFGVAFSSRLPPASGPSPSPPPPSQFMSWRGTSAANSHKAGGPIGGGGGGGGASRAMSAHPEQCYTFLAGDLNYRLTCSLEESLQAIVAAGAEEAARPQGSAAPDGSRPWQRLLRADQMRREMERGTLLPGFAEPPVAFPPSYRRVKGERPTLLRTRGDLADLQRVRDAYATVVKKVGNVEVVSQPPEQQGPGPVGLDAASTAAAGGDDAGIKRSELRVPSYTDRCLVRSPLMAGVHVGVRAFASAQQRRRAQRRLSRGGLGGAGDAGASSSSLANLLESEGAASADSSPPTSFVPLPALRCLSYDCCDAVSVSDHAPVAAVWELPLQQPRGTVPRTRPDSDFRPLTGPAPFPVALPSPLGLLLLPAGMLPAGSLASPPAAPATVAPLHAAQAAESAGTRKDAGGEGGEEGEDDDDEGCDTPDSLESLPAAPGSVPHFRWVRLLPPSSPLFDAALHAAAAAARPLAPAVLEHVRAITHAAALADEASQAQRQRRRRTALHLATDSIDRIAAAGLAVPPRGLVLLREDEDVGD